MIRRYALPRPQNKSRQLWSSEPSHPTAFCMGWASEGTVTSWEQVDGRRKCISGHVFILSVVCNKIRRLLKVMSSFQIGYDDGTLFISTSVLLWSSNVHHRYHKNPPLNPILSHLSPVYVFTIFIRSVLILSSHLFLGIPTGIFRVFSLHPNTCPVYRNLNKITDKMIV